MKEAHSLTSGSCSEPETNVTNSNGTIKSISQYDIHRICSGQVVLTLAIAVKELLENSLDAGSSSVEVRLKDHGSTFVEVTDDGKGVHPSDFEGLALKHHTSKIQDFGDVVGVKTFGFRGEALSSLCALSNFTVVTRHSSEEVGTRLQFDHSGKLIEESPVPRQVGTTVSLHNLFSTLPVRHKEFMHNVKREFNKMVQLLTAYCIITTNVRISCIHYTDKGKKTTVLSTDGSQSIKENILSVFGPKQMSSLLELKQKDASPEVLHEYSISETSLDGKSVFHIRGYISSCAHGLGRSSTDRQFFYINSRPCDPGKVAKLVNEVYHIYNRHQYPMVVLDIKTMDSDVDVNVTPDKRTIFVSQEKLLLATLKETLLNLYEKVPSTFKVQQMNTSPGSTWPGKISTSVDVTKPKLSSSLIQKFCSYRMSPSGEERIHGVKRHHGDDDIGVKKPFLVEAAHKESRNLAAGDQEVREQTGDPVVEKNLTEVCVSDPEYGTSDQHVNDGCDVVCEVRSVSDSQLGNISEITPIQCPKQCSVSSSTAPHKHATSTPSRSCRSVHSATDSFLKGLHSRRMTAGPKLKSRYDSGVLCLTSHSSPTVAEAGHQLHQKTEHIPVAEDDVVMLTEHEAVVAPVANSLPEVVLEEMDQQCKRHRKNRTVHFSAEWVKWKAERKREDAGVLVCRKFRAKIDPSQNTSAEEELKKEITKGMFREMQIIGQFNVGFIITKLGPDLFIIDQHATDEKYNFEMLQQTCLIQNQRLFFPLPLELTPANESVLLENLDIFEKNGFHVKVEEGKPPGRRVSLISMPHSHGWEFGKQDIDELIFMLSDAPGTMCRPSRVQQMFASRACRKSVMIGTALSYMHMRTLVDHMGEMSQPWNCPHGRPTMRHLINLNIIAKNES